MIVCQHLKTLGNQRVALQIPRPSASNGKKVVLLQTAQAIAIGESAQIPIRILLDSRSKLSYITNSLRERLRLKSVQWEKLSLNTFGNSSFSIQSCDVVCFHICKAGSAEKIEVLTHHLSSVLLFQNWLMSSSMNISMAWNWQIMIKKNKHQLMCSLGLTVTGLLLLARQLLDMKDLWL